MKKENILRELKVVYMIKKTIEIERYWQTNNKKFLNLEIYEGFASKKDAISFMEKLFLTEERYAIIEFLNMFYVVVFENYDKEIMIGKEVTWYCLNKDMYNVSTKNFKLPFSINSLASRNTNPAIANDLRKIDPNLNVYKFKSNGWQNVNQYQYSKTFATLLGLTFYSDMFCEDDIHVLTHYFDTGFYRNIFKGKRGIVEINPFQSRAKLPSGKIIRFRCN